MSEHDDQYWADIDAATAHGRDENGEAIVTRIFPTRDELIATLGSRSNLGLSETLKAAGMALQYPMGMLAHLPAPKTADDYLVFTHPRVGYRTYQLPDDASGYVTYWPSPTWRNPRVVRYVNDDGIGMIAETVHLFAGEPPDATILRLLGVTT